VSQVASSKHRRDVSSLRDMMMSQEFYASLDVGIRFAVRVLHAAGGIETCQSCQGGKGHSYDRPTVDMIATGDDAIGFRALSALADYDLPVADVAILWNVRHHLPYEKLWRITFTHTMEDRADELPFFVNGYYAQGRSCSPMKRSG
jgi:hypothetical protein